MLLLPYRGEVITDNAASIADDSVTAAKLANSINTEIAANTAKVTNATHTGDVTGATALTIATDAVDIAMLSATGTASSSTFLRGDNAWAVVASAITREGGDSTEATTTSTSAVDLLAASSLTIGATEPFLQMHNGRKTSGAANYTPCGYKMNSTTIGEATGSNVRGWYSSGTNQAEDGGAWAIMGPRVTNYQAFSRGLRSSHISGTNAAGINGTAAHLSQMTTDAVMPIATVTDFVIRGLTLNASNTLGADELQLYSYAAS
jgi:hypothetical protein